MERDNLLQISRVKDLFNPALPNGQRLWGDVIDLYVGLNRKRLTKHVIADFVALNGKPLTDAKKEAVAALLGRVGRIVQRRHDIAHNCDRPRYAYSAMTAAQATDAHLDAHRLY